MDFFFYLIDINLYKLCRYAMLYAMKTINFQKFYLLPCWEMKISEKIPNNMHTKIKIFQLRKKIYKKKTNNASLLRQYEVIPIGYKQTSQRHIT